MAISLSDYKRRIADSGLLASAEVEAFISSLPGDRQPEDGQGLARQLVQEGKLTAYQAQAIYHGKGRALTLGNYVILNKVGQGGMGIVFRAQHRRMHRVVALKVLSSSGRKVPGSVERFQREVRAAGWLEHPNIVTAYDAGEAGGVEFLVMQYVNGTNLCDLVKERGPLPVSMAVSCTLQAAHGLQYAHHRGVVHRDIKPANLLLDRDGTVKILDMGLARFESRPPGAADPELTNAGQIMGTADYMAPEQTANMSQSDGRADIYSLGYTLWYLLTGTEAYAGANRMEKLVAHWERPIPCLRQACPEASAELAAVFKKMVAKKPENRYQTMAEVIADLERSRTAEAAAPRHTPDPVEDQELQEFFKAFPELPAHREVRNSERAAADRRRSGNTNSGLVKPAIPNGARSPRRTATGSTTATTPAREGKKWERRLVLLIAAVVAAVALAALIAHRNDAPLTTDPLGASPAPPEVDSDWIALFNGVDLQGWRVLGNGTWTVENATIIGTGEGGWLATEEITYADFELSLHFRIAEGGDSGVFLRAWHEAQTSELLEVQILDSTSPTHQTLPSDQKTAGLVEIAAPLTEVAALPTNWHHVIVRVQGRHVQLWFDGRYALDVNLDDAGLQRPAVHRRHAGCIGLEIGRQSVQFRDIRLRPLNIDESSFSSARDLLGLGRQV